MNRRNFMGALLATATGCALAAKAKLSPVEETTIANQAAQPLNGGEAYFEWVSGTDGVFWHTQMGDKHFTQFARADGTNGYSDQPPSALLDAG